MIYSTLWFNTKFLFCKSIKSKSKQAPFFFYLFFFVVCERERQREREKLNEETNHSKQEAEVKLSYYLGSCKGIV
jgi:hypothetical protein